MRLSNFQRASLRRAVTQSPGWPAFRASRNMSSGDLDRRGFPTTLDAATEMGLDVSAILGDAPQRDNQLQNWIDRAPAPDAPKPVIRNPAEPMSEPQRKLLMALREKASGEGLLDRVGDMPKTKGDASAEIDFIRDMLARNAPPREVSPLLPNETPDDAPAPQVDGVALHRMVQQAVDAATAPLRAEIAALTAQQRQTVVVLHSPDLPPVKLDGKPHPLFPELLQAVNSRDAGGERPNIWIAGPAGSGKTYAAEQVAKVLGLEYGFHGAMTMSHELVGFVDAGGTYHETQFVKRFRDGGVILLDECDAGANEALLSLNAALANGKASLPTGEIVRRHPDCIVIGAANTFGAGATAEYIGRAKLDAAFMSRFPVKFHWTYDDAVESAICGNPDWAAEVQKARRIAGENGIKVVIDPRQSKAGAALLAAGFAPSRVAELTYLATMTDDQKSIMRRAMRGL